MPYILPEDRKRLDIDTPKNAGELNYSFTMLVLNQDENLELEMRYLITAYIAEKGLRYQYCNDIVGAVFASEMELKRRWGNKYNVEIDIMFRVIKDYYRVVIGPYEDKKIKENTDII